MRIFILLLLCCNLQACFNEPENPAEVFEELGEQFDEIGEAAEELETDIEDAIDVIGRQQVYVTHSVNKDGFVIPNSSTLEITISQAEARPYGRKNGKDRLKVDAQIRCTGDIPFTNNNVKNNPYYEDYDYSHLNCEGSLANIFKGEKKIKSKLKNLYINYNICSKEFFFVVIGTEDDLVIMSQKNALPEEVGINIETQP